MNEGIDASLVMFWIFHQNDCDIPIEIGEMIVKFCADMIFGNWRSSESFDDEKEYDQFNQWLDSYYRESVDSIRKEYTELNNREYQRIYTHVVDLTDICIVSAESV